MKSQNKIKYRNLEKLIHNILKDLCISMYKDTYYFSDNEIYNYYLNNSSFTFTSVAMIVKSGRIIILCGSIATITYEDFIDQFGATSQSVLTEYKKRLLKLRIKVI